LYPHEPAMAAASQSAAQEAAKLEVCDFESLRADFRRSEGCDLYPYKK
jgi:hypothetical protein